MNQTAGHKLPLTLRHADVRLEAPSGFTLGRLVTTNGMFASSTVRAHDTNTGLLGRSTVQQVETAVHNLQELVWRAGVRTTDIGLLTASFSPDEVTGALDAKIRGLLADAGISAARKTNAYQLPGSEKVQLQVVGALAQRCEPITLRGTNGAVIANGVRSGGVVFTSAIDGRDPFSGRFATNRKTQMRQAFHNAEALVEQAGGSKANIAHVFIFIQGREHQQDMLDVWLEEFPEENRPSRKAIFDDVLQGGECAIQLLLVAVIGQGPRQVIQLPGVSKKHPNPLATRTGNLIFTSGINGQQPGVSLRDGSVERRAELAFDNLQAIVETGGGRLNDISQVAITVNDYSDEGAILRCWRARFPAQETEPALHVMAYGGRGSYPVQLHAMAALPN